MGIEKKETIRKKGEKKGTGPFFSLVKDKDLTPFNF
jgi:hypothetical protein